MSGRLQDKIALITGATTGIGLATARRFIAEGAHVVIVARSGEEVRIAKELGDRATPAHADLLSPGAIKRLFDLVEEKFGRLDVLFNNAGTSVEHTTLDRISETVIDEVLNVNARAVLLASKYALPLLKQSGGGAIINTASTTALRSEPLLVTYATAKGGVVGMTYSLARELGPYGIRVNTICPGPINTPLFREHVSDELRARLSARTALHRLGLPEEVAAVALFLASDDSAFVTGTCLPVDGGFIC